MSKRSKLIQEEKSFKLQLDKIVDNVAEIKNSFIVKNVWIEVSNWKESVENDIYGNKFYQYRIDDSNITSKDIVDINFAGNDIVLNHYTDGIYPVTSSYDGYVYIYSSKIPSNRMNAYIIIKKRWYNNGLW